MVCELALRPKALLLKACAKEPVPSTPCMATEPEVPIAKVGDPSNLFK